MKFKDFLKKLIEEIFKRKKPCTHPKPYNEGYCTKCGKFMGYIPEPDPQPEQNAPEFVQTTQGRVRWSDLKETGKIVDFTFDASGFWSHNEKKPAWPPVDQYGQDGFICLVFKPEGSSKWECYHWDCGMNQDYKYVSLFHITDPGADCPFQQRVKKGMIVGNLFVRYDMTERTNIVWSTWPLNT